ncbi:MAG TPA: metallophosphoesterase [Bacteroidota bacterium]|nr:metallophosphoesterase [Bacteroidota bacterium]
MAIPWILIVISFVSLGVTYIGRRLIRTSGLPRPWRVVAWTVLILLFVLPIVSVAFIRRNGASSLVLSWVTYVGLGFLSSVFFLLLARDTVWFLARFGRKVLALVARRQTEPDPARRQFLLQSTNLGILGAAALATSYGIYEARKTPGLVSLDIPIPRLPEAFDGFRIVQICDIHAGLTVDRDWVEKVVEEVQKQSGDLIAFVGDMVDGSVPALESTVAPLADLRAPYGKFFTTGNHEYYSGAEQWIKHAAVLGFDVLMNEHRKIEKNGSTIILAGVTDYTAGQFFKDQASDPHKAVEQTANDDVRILMAHQPRSLYQFGDLKIDFTMNGHTHGGQFIPWNLFATIGQPFIKGLHRWNEGLVYVSKGTGYWGPPVRLGARSEVTVFTLKKG